MDDIIPATAGSNVPDSNVPGNVAPGNVAPNGNAVLRYLLEHRQATKAQLAQDLHLSAPTITSTLNGLERDGIVQPGPQLKSTGGRKARTHRFNPRHRTAVSATIRRHTLELNALDLDGTVVATVSRALPYRDVPAYWQRAYHAIDDFTETVGRRHGKVLGVMMTHDGTMSAAETAHADRTGGTGGDATSGLTAGTDRPASAGSAPTATGSATALASTGTSFAAGNTPSIGTSATSPTNPTTATGTAPADPSDILRTHWPILHTRPCDAAATAELWHDRNLANAIFLYLDRTPSCAIALDRHTLGGDAAATGLATPPYDAIAHMTLVPQGRPCRCGRLGCMAAYCSPESLTEDYESIPGFFSVLEQGETHHRARMDEWLGWVALCIANLRRIIPADVIIAGEAAQYLDDDDMADLHARIRLLQPAALQDFTLRTGRCGARECGTDPVAEGAALRLVQRYLETIAGGGAGI
ncbi:ROK family protein [Bifidobacterium leontopitheci]|uniref:NagC family transcriptional regulator n=1 Tax=Bifidobacterium leontopitheci TaxID=2650774 RepID=A0A6I1GMV2_9BIFI|nr:ROK family protein [Bifidobacterium leontopitheci]KAB7790886.1 NagC family transcriptional regulator [Bifidobacterium leontopitheci]